MLVLYILFFVSGMIAMQGWSSIIHFHKFEFTPRWSKVFDWIVTPIFSVAALFFLVLLILASH